MRSERIVEKTEVVAENGIVAAMHPLAAEAGMEILQQGGNAADAAVATAFAVGVVEPFMSGLGGLAYIVVHDAVNNKTVPVNKTGVSRTGPASNPGLLRRSGAVSNPGLLSRSGGQSTSGVLGSPAPAPSRFLKSCRRRGRKKRHGSS